MAEKIYADIQTLEPGSEIVLYELDATNQGGEIAYFHAHRQAEPIIWQGVTYHAFPVEATGFGASGSESQPTPELTVGDPNGGITTLCKLYKDLANAKFTRKRTLLRFLDAENFTKVVEQNDVTVDPLTVTHVDLDNPVDGEPVVDVINISNIVLTDPLGTHALDPEPRRNLCQDSSDFLIQSNGATATYPYQTSPSGEPTTLMWAGVPMVRGVRMRSNVIFVQGVTYTTSVFVRPKSPNSPRVALAHPDPRFPTGQAALSDIAGVADSVGSPKGYGAQMLPGGWIRLWITAECTSTGSSGDVRVMMEEAPLEDDGWEVFGLHVEETEQPTKYIKTSGGARYVTDYRTPVIKTLILDETPIAGSSLTYDIVLRVLSGAMDPDPDEHFPDDVFYIQQKTEQLPGEYVKFALRSALDLEGSVIPSRPIIKNVCGWATIGRYRGPECQYTGTRYFDINDNPVDTPDKDVCSYRLSGCQARFGKYAELPFGGFPGTSLIRG